MPSEVICPTCGQALRIELRDEPPGPAISSPAAARTMEVVIPGTMTSCDDFDESEVSLASPDPDPVLGRFVCGDATPESDGSDLRIPGSDELPPSAAATSDPLAALNLDGVAASSPAASPDSGSSDEVSTDDAGPRGPGLGFVLLASYASAITLACLWLVLSGRGRWQPRAAETIPADSRPDLAVQGEQAQRVAPVPPVPEDRLTTLGQPLRIGALELTPLSIEVAPVVLEHATSPGARRETRHGGSDTLRLRLRLRNISEEGSFAPLEQSFVREHDRGLPDSFIETGRGDRIDIYPLAAESEWALVGQKFPELKPGESAETVIASAPDAIRRAADPMTWRLKVNTGTGETETVGVRFSQREISSDRQ